MQNMKYKPSYFLLVNELDWYSLRDARVTVRVVDEVIAKLIKQKGANCP